MARKNVSKPTDIQANLKEAHVLKLRLAGHTFEQIAEQTGYANAGGAYKAFQRAMSKTLQEPADELRKLEVERLDRLFEVAYEKAVSGDRGALFAVDRCLTIQQRRAQLLGLDAPQRKVINVLTEDAMDAAIRELEAQLAENDEDTPGDVRVSGAAGEARPAA